MEFNNASTDIILSQVQIAMKRAEAIQAEMAMKQAECNLDFLADPCRVCGKVMRVEDRVIYVCKHRLDWIRENLRDEAPVSRPPVLFDPFALEIRVED